MTVRLTRLEEVSLVLWLADLPGLREEPPALLQAKLAEKGFYAEQAVIREALVTPSLPEDLVERVRRRLGEEAAREVAAFLGEA